MPTLIVTVVNARDLVAMDLSGTSDPYCVVKCGGQRVKTHTIYTTLNPSWGTQFTLSVMNPAIESVTFELFDYDVIGRDDPLGSASVPLNTLRQGVTERRRYELE